MRTYIWYGKGKQSLLMRAISFLFITLFLSVALSCHATACAQSPPAATLISPTGSIETSVPAFNWNGAADATWYYLWVNDSTGNVLKQWYRSLDICGSGAECSVAPGVALQAGAGRWWVQAWNPDGYGPWSTSLSFVAGGGAIPEAATLIAPQNNINNSTP
ncbi:MAG: hypothetical protein KAG66_07380, partial [Methylococcales bacterium]|nr:hypothetical protein [Methylococcales bacterium]